MYLYHNVSSLKLLEKILIDGYVYKHHKLGCVCMTRSFNYLSYRGIRMVFDYDKLKHNYKIKPFSLRGNYLLRGMKWIPKQNEMEERIYNDVSLSKCVRIDIDKNKFKNIDFNNHLINHTIQFDKKFSIIHTTN